MFSTGSYCINKADFKLKKIILHGDHFSKYKNTKLGEI